LTSWKACTAMMLLVTLSMFVLVGLLFGLVFGTAFDCVEYLTIRSTLFMLLFGLIAMLACYFATPRDLSVGKDWIPILRPDAPHLVDAVIRMSVEAGIPVPRLYVVPSRVPNAFCYGRKPDKAFICINSGLLDLLSERELEAVIGHEISHLAHKDSIVNGIARNCAKALTISSFLVGILSIIFLGSMNAETGQRSGSNVAGPAVLILIIFGLLFLLFAALMLATVPGAAIVMRFGVSRNREYLADAGSAEITGDPQALIDALRKMDSACAGGDARYKAGEASKFTVDPNGVRGRERFTYKVMSTHPSTKDRIKRLEKIRDRMEAERPPSAVPIEAAETSAEEPLGGEQGDAE